MEVAEVVLVVAFLGWLVSAGLGLTAMINPSWFGLSTRFRAAIIFFGIASLCFVIVAVSASSMPTSDLGKGDTDVASKEPIPTPTPLVETGKDTSESIALQSLWAEFDSLTDLQQDEWRNRNEWQYSVHGECQHIIYTFWDSTSLTDTA